MVCPCFVAILLLKIMRDCTVWTPMLCGFINGRWKSENSSDKVAFFLFFVRFLIRREWDQPDDVPRYGRRHGFCCGGARRDGRPAPSRPKPHRASESSSGCSSVPSKTSNTSTLRKKIPCMTRGVDFGFLQWHSM